MHSEKELERQKEVDTAINYGLLNKDIVTVVDAFSEQYKINKSSFLNGIIDPGIKSTDSIISKLYRKHEIEQNKEFYLTDIKDIIRCSIIVDNYNQVIPLIRQLRKFYPSLNGDICENETGYIGIHLLFNLNGTNAEMQISTSDGWYAKQAGESIYEKWRDFNFTKEYNEIFAAKNQIEKLKKLDKLFQNYTLRNSDLVGCQTMFFKVHEHTKLKILKDKINAVLCVNNIKENTSSNKNKYKVQIYNHDILKLECDTYTNLASKEKDKFLKSAKLALQSIKINSNIEVNLTNEEKVFMYLKEKYFGLIDNELKSKFKNEYNNFNYISSINKLANSFALSALNKLEELKYIETLFNVEKDIIYKKEIKKLENRIKIDIITKLKLNLLKSSN